jgi:hypothetical protein
MKLFLLIYILTTYTLFANYYDSDIDGVEDKFDLCDNTPFDEVVDEFGCGENASHSTITLKIGADVGFDTLDEKSTSYNFLIHYTMKHWSIGVSNSDYIGYTENNVSQRETGDIYSYIGYEIPNEKLITTLMLGTKIATANERVGTGKNDYYTSVQIESIPIKNNLKLFSTFSYTFTGDTSSIEYEDVFSYQIGFGYYVNASYFTSLYYENSQSIYEDTQNYKALVWTNRYSYDDTYFVEFDYTRGLDAFSYEHMFSFRVGAHFE